SQCGFRVRRPVMESDGGVGAQPKMESDEDLVARFQETREPGHFAPLFERYRAGVLRYCYKRLGRTELAADASQDTFVKVFTEIDKYKKSDRASFRGWVYTIAHDVAENYRLAADERRPERGDELLLSLAQPGSGNQ